MKLKMRMEMELLNEQQLRHALEQAIVVWEKMPFRVQGTDEYFDYLTAYGCRIDGEMVRFPKPVIDKVLARHEEEKRRIIAEQASTELPWSGTDLKIFTHGQGLHICDLETNQLRPCTESDLISWSHAVDRFGDVERDHPTFIPQDAPLGSQDLHAFATIALNSRKLHCVSVFSARMLPFFIEISKAVLGSLFTEFKNAREAGKIFRTMCWINSPFMITRENIDIAMAARRLLGNPIIFGHMPVAAGSSPVTVMGSLVQNTAESLALSAMSLAIDGRIHGIQGTTAMIDMRDICQRTVGPDLFLHRVAAVQMNSYLLGYHPNFAGTWMNRATAQSVSAQSLYEKAMNLSFSFAFGIRNLHIGQLGTSDVGSPVQLLLDYEIIQLYRHMLREVNTDDEHVGLETILATAPRGAYFMETEHTAQFFREECFFPAFVDHRAPLAWAQNPTDMIAKARQKARDWFATAKNQCPLSEEQKREIRTIVAEADKAVR